MNRTIFLCPVLLGFAAFAQNSERMVVPMAAGYNTLLTLSPDKPEAAAAFGIDSGDSVSVSVYGSSQTMRVSLIDPAGGEHAAGATDSVVADSFAGAASESSPIRQFEFSLVNAPPGKWEVRVSESAPFTGVRFAQLSMNLKSDLVAGLLGVDRDYPIDRNFTLAFVLVDVRGALPAGAVGSL